MENHFFINQNKLRKLLLLLACVSLFILTFTACGTSTCARLIKAIDITGTVSYCREQVTQDVYLDMNFQPGDDVQTATESNLTLQLDVDRFLYLFENTKISMDYSGDESDNKTYITLENGEVYTSIGAALSNDSEYEIRTSNATIGVRGTQFYVATKSGKTIVYCKEGVVKVTAADNEIEIVANEAAVVEDGKAQKTEVSDIQGEIDLLTLDFGMATIGSSSASGNGTVAPSPSNMPTGQGTATNGHFTYYIYEIDDGDYTVPVNTYYDANGNVVSEATYDVDGHTCVVTEVMNNNFYLSGERTIDGEIVYTQEYHYDDAGMETGCTVWDADGNVVLEVEVLNYYDNNYPCDCVRTDYLHLENGEPSVIEFTATIN